MTRKRPKTHSFLDAIKEYFTGTPSRPTARRRLRFESLEGRRVMDGTLSGHLYRDVNNNNAYDAGESAMQGVLMRLYRDNGDGVFNDATDTSLRSTRSDAGGEYTFANVALGTYFVRRPAQQITTGPQAGIKLTNWVSSATTLSEMKTVIDDFNHPATQAAAIDSTNNNVAASSIASGIPTASTIGGEREILADFNGNGVGTGIQISGRVSTVTLGGDQIGLLLLEASSGGSGTYTVVWDGADGVASTSPNLAGGLNNADLTANGATALKATLNSLDLNGATLRVFVYTDATHFSTASLPLLGQVIDGVAQTGGKTSYNFRFDGIGSGGFATGTGAAGGADFSRVRAVVMQVDASANDIDARFDTFAAYGPALAVVDSAVDEVDVSLVKSVSNAAPAIGDVIDWTVVVTNATQLANGKNTVKATGVTVKDLLFTGADASKLTFVSSSAPNAFNSTTGMWSVGELNPGQSKTLTIKMRVNDAARPSVTNVAQVTSVQQPDPDVDDWTDDAIITPVFVDIGVTKTVNNQRPHAGETVTFTMTAKNNGTVGATEVKLSDKIDAASMAGFTFVSANSTLNGSYNSTTGVWTLPALAVNQTATLKIIGTVNTATVKTNDIDLLSLGGGAIDVNPNNNHADATLTPWVTDIGVLKSVVAANGQAANASPTRTNPIVNFRLRAVNNGPTVATDVKLTDRLPAGLTFVSTDSANYNSATGVWNVGTLGVSESKTLLVTARLADGLQGVAIDNTVELTGLAEFDSDPTNNKSTVTLTPQRIDLNVTKTVDDAAPNFGQNVNFTVTVTNAGPNVATNVKLFEPLASGLAFVSSSPSKGSHDVVTGQWTIGTLAVGETVTLGVTTTVTSMSRQTNTVQISAADQDDVDSTPNNNVATEDDQASVSVVPERIDLSVTKTVNDATPDLNQQINFTITVTNSGPSVATNVKLFEPLASGLAFVSSSPSKGSHNVVTGQWTIGTLAVGETVTMSVITTVTSTSPQTNVVEISAADQTDVDSTPNNNVVGEDDRASVTVQVNSIDLNVTKAVDNATPTIGTNVNWVITLTNAGPGFGTGVQLLELIPAGLTYLSHSQTLGAYSPVSGLWNVGTISVGQTVTLIITTRVDTATRVVNTTEVHTANQVDIDSTPNNSVASEDDLASATIVPRTLPPPIDPEGDPDPFSKRRFLAR